MSALPSSSCFCNDEVVSTSQVLIFQNLDQDAPWLLNIPESVFGSDINVMLIAESTIAVGGSSIRLLRKQEHDTH